MTKTGGRRARNMPIIDYAKVEFDLFLGLVASTDALCMLPHREKWAETGERRRGISQSLLIPKDDFNISKGA